MLSDEHLPFIAHQGEKDIVGKYVQTFLENDWTCSVIRLCAASEECKVGLRMTAEEVKAL